MKAFTPWVSNLYRYRNRVRESANISNQFICLGTYFSLFSPSPFSAVKCSNVHTHTHTHTHTGTLLKQKCEALCHQFNLLKSYVSLISSSLCKASFIPCCCCCCEAASVVSNSVQPPRQQPTRLPRPWDSPAKNTGVGCHFLLQCRKVKSESEVAQSCLTLSNPIDCSLPGSSIHGIFQARVLEWGAC